MNSNPNWLVDDPVAEHELGVLRSGKEAQIDLVERVGADGRTCLVARKRYLPRSVKSKGELEAMGLQRASTFRHDVEYREGRQFRKTRDRRAVEQMSTYGKKLLQDRWTSHEYDVMRALWESGCSVPYPISFGEDRFDMEFVGDREQAAPQLGRARLSRSEVRDAWHDLLDGLRAITAAGWAHGDLSAYNLLWWEGRLWFIDFPQAVDIAANPNGVAFLHRDVVNVCGWFSRQGIDDDPEEVFADLLGAAFG
ncbi:RIO1 family regulatory kinase/ATPase domain-containing protein [Actinospongicola halichondriae]|uniref:RIO1 family regulatory kinase/ATPase domain-containing protein n=1 Tax=Actinospongicola halichondriae TaxID=3236844 RepID=UPI003D5689C3